MEKECPTTKDEASAGVVLFGKYEIVKLLGFGAFAKVYHARNVNTMESVAVKAVSKRKVQKNGYAAHVEREVSIMRRLRHQHTVELFEVLATKTKIYFVMEFASGGDLFGVIAAEGRFTEDLSRRYFRQLISAVKYCHSRGVFHRDLKLDNLLVDENKNLKVSDFGLGAIKDRIRPEDSLHTVCGTPAYVAPEILARKGYDGATVDVWSCGVVLFVLTAGYLPFNDYNITVLYRKIYRGQFRFPKWTSHELSNLLSRLLDTNPNTRITVDEIMRDPWFSHGGYTDTWVGSDPEREKNYQVVTKRLNAFDLISFSSGLDMSGLFTYPEHSDCTERFVTEELSEKVVETVQEVAEMERVVRVIKGEGGCGRVRLEGLDCNFVIVVGVYRLTDELYVVEVKKSERGGASSGERFWRDALKPRLLALALKPDVPVSR